MEIKFRGKRLDNGEIVCGGYHKHMRFMECPIDSPDPNSIMHLITVDGFADWNMPVPIESYPVDPITIEQYFGDEENGEEIWVNAFFCLGYIKGCGMLDTI